MKRAKDRTIDLPELSGGVAVAPRQIFQDIHDRSKQIVEILNERREKSPRVGLYVRARGAIGATMTA
jgi:hypothetical protein